MIVPAQHNILSYLVFIIKLQFFLHITESNCADSLLMSLSKTNEQKRADRLPWTRLDNFIYRVIDYRLLSQGYSREQTVPRQKCTWKHGRAQVDISTNAYQDLLVSGWSMRSKLKEHWRKVRNHSDQMGYATLSSLRHITIRLHLRRI
jgi:hypothetical protein